MCVKTVCSVLSIIFAAAWWTAVRAASPVPAVPDRVRAVAGSCVVIPCSFAPPAQRPGRARKERVNVRLRARGGGGGGLHLFPLRIGAFNSEDADQVSADFKGRTSLFGQLAAGDCSVKIERIGRDDARVFDVALKRADDFQWGRPKSFSLEVVDTPEAPVISGTLAATEGQLVTLNCSVSYGCPSGPPALQWIWERGEAQPNGTEQGEVQRLQPEPHRRVLLAPLSFTVSHGVKPRLRCEARYPGAQVLAALKDLHVTFSPKDVTVQVQTLVVQEGGSALLVCSCKADPPATEYRWSYSQRGGLAVHLHRRTDTIRVFNVTRGTTVRCSATNLIGRGESRPTPLNVQYKPAILRPSSACVVDDLELLCRCSVDSNPEPAIAWSVNGTSPTHAHNTSVTSGPGGATATLRGRVDGPQTVICFAANALGNDSATLLRGGEETPSLLWLVIPAAATCLVIVLLTLLFHCLRKRARKHVLNRRPAAYTAGRGIRQDRMPLYVNCTEVTHIYTNGSYQLIYQNCTPLFVHTKQTHPMGRRGGERRRGGEGGGMDRRADLRVRGTREVQSEAVDDAETAIYLEIL